MKNPERHLLGKHPKIGSAEEADPDAARAAIWHVENGFILPTLVGHKKGILWCTKEPGTDINGVEVAGMESFANRVEMVSYMLVIRRGDWAREACEDRLKDIGYFSAMCLELGYIDGLVDGIIVTTTGTTRPALQPIRTTGNERAAFSRVLLKRGSTHYIIGDCTLNVDPSVQELMETTLQCTRTARQFDIEPETGILSYPSLGPGNGESVDKMHVIAGHLRQVPLDSTVDGEIQMDAAISPTVAEARAPHSAIARETNTLILPNIDAGNVNYRVAVGLGSFTMFDPILQDLCKSVSILMRGAGAGTIYSVGIITGVQVVENRSRKRMADTVFLCF